MASIMLGQHIKKPIEPATRWSTYNIMNEFFKFIEPEFYSSESKDLFTRLYRIIEVVFQGSDPLIDERDIKPFIIINFVQFPVMLMSTLV